jgi:hypothetical protein
MIARTQGAPSHSRHSTSQVRPTLLTSALALDSISIYRLWRPWSFGVAKMAKRLAILWLFSLVLGAIVDGRAASTLKITCSGELTNTRADGVTLGQCDLNFISVKEMTEIESACGIPGTVDTLAENQCRIRAIVSPNSTRAADHRNLYRVLEVWSVDKR